MKWNVGTKVDGAIRVFLDVTKNALEAFKVAGARCNAEAPHSSNMDKDVKSAQSD